MELAVRRHIATKKIVCPLRGHELLRWIADCAGMKDDW